VLGSGELVQSLMQRNLVDEYVLLIHPLVLGSGRRLFTDGSAFTALRLVDTKTSSTGVVIATYQPAEPTAGKNT
jgi:dihydrofolate reductase